MANFQLQKRLKNANFQFISPASLHQLQLFCGHFREDYGKSYQFGNGG